MDASRVPPAPQRPNFDESKPRGSWLTIWMAATLGISLAVLLTFLTIGFFGPVILLAVGVFAVIAVQYCVWGWLFERIYRSGPVEDEGLSAAPKVDGSPVEPAGPPWRPPFVR